MTRCAVRLVQTSYFTVGWLPEVSAAELRRQVLDRNTAAFRDEYKNELQAGNYGEYKRFEDCYKEVLRQVEEQTRAEGPKAMKTFQESQKSQKTVASLVEKKGGADKKDKGKASKADTKANDAKTIEASESTPEGITNQ